MQYTNNSGLEFKILLLMYLKYEHNWTFFNPDVNRSIGKKSNPSKQYSLVSGFTAKKHLSKDSK